MKIRAAQFDISQIGRSHSGIIVLIIRDLSSSGIFNRRSHTDIMKRIVGLKISGVTGTAICHAGIEKICSALFGGG